MSSQLDSLCTLFDEYITLRLHVFAAKMARIDYEVDSIGGSNQNVWDLGPVEQSKVRHCVALLSCMSVNMVAMLLAPWVPWMAASGVFWFCLNCVFVVLIQHTKSPEWVGCLMIFTYASVHSLFDPGPGACQYRIINLLPTALFILQRKGVMVVVAVYFIIVGLNRYTGFLRSDSDVAVGHFFMHSFVYQSAQVCMCEGANQFLSRAWERAVIYKAELRYRMSHELRTPLFSIMGAVDLLKKTQLDSWQTQLLQMVAGCSQNLISLVSGLLDFGQMQTGRSLEIHKRTTCVKELLHTVMTVSKPMAIAKGIFIETELDQLVPKHFYTDGMRLHQVMVNLISNSIKFTPSGGIIRFAISLAPPGPFPSRCLSCTLNLTTTIGSPPQAQNGKDNPVKDSARWLRLSVSDSGIGMDDATLSQVFQPYQTARPSSHPGTGIGLSISKYLVQCLGGILKASSAGPGHGSQFTVWIPLEPSPPPSNSDSPTLKALTGLKSPVARKTPPISPTPKDSPIAKIQRHSTAPLTQIPKSEESSPAPRPVLKHKATPNKQLNALVAEDNPFNQVLIKKMGEMIGVKMEVVGNGLELVDRLLAGQLPPPIATVPATAAGSLETPLPEFHQPPVPVEVGPVPELATAVAEGSSVELSTSSESSGSFRRSSSSSSGSPLVKSWKSEFDLLIIDLEMPVLNGMECTKQLRSRGVTLPVVIMSSHTLEIQRKLMGGTNVQGFLSKPITTDSLQESISSALYQPTTMNYPLGKGSPSYTRTESGASKIKRQ